MTALLFYYFLFIVPAIFFVLIMYKFFDKIIAFIAEIIKYHG